MNPADVQRYPSSVRLPSHVEPPYKARTWGDSRFLTVVGFPGDVGIPFLFTQFSGPSSGNIIPPFGNAPQAVGIGERAEITWVQVTAADQAFAVNAAPIVIRGSIRKGKGTGILTTAAGGVQGWQRFGIGSINTDEVPGVPINVAKTLVGVTQRMEAPIHLEENETATLFITFDFFGAATTWDIRAGWGGWIYPVELEGEAGTIRGTAQDPGIRHPLENPFRSR